MLVAKVQVLCILERFAPVSEVPPDGAAMTSSFQMRAFFLKEVKYET